MEFPGGGGSTARPSGTENPGGWGGQTGKTLRGGGMDIFWNHTISAGGKKQFCVALGGLDLKKENHKLDLQQWIT